MADQEVPFNMSSQQYGGLQIGQQNILNGVSLIRRSICPLLVTLCRLESKSRLQTVTDWFSPIDFAQKQKDVYSHEYASSKESFFELEDFKRWKRGDVQVLWCHGARKRLRMRLESIVC